MFHCEIVCGSINEFKGREYLCQFSSDGLVQGKNIFKTREGKNAIVRGVGSWRCEDGYASYDTESAFGSNKELFQIVALNFDVILACPGTAR
jgi:hypothetical protein